MTVTFGFFNSQDGDRKYNAVQISELFDGLITDGVYSMIGDHFNVSLGTDSSGGYSDTVIVGTGRAWFNHTWTKNDSPIYIKIAEPPAIYNRIDSIVLEIDLTRRENRIKMLVGEENSTPKPPTLSKEDNLYQYPLAYIDRPKDVTAINQTNITNMVGTSETPFVIGVLKGMDIDFIVSKWEAQWTSEWESLLNMKEEEFHKWFDNLQEISDGDVVVNITNKLLELEEKLQETDTSLISNKEFRDFVRDFTIQKSIGKITSNVMDLKEFDKIDSMAITFCDDFCVYIPESIEKEQTAFYQVQMNMNKITSDFVKETVVLPGDMKIYPFSNTNKKTIYKINEYNVSKNLDNSINKGYYYTIYNNSEDNKIDLLLGLTGYSVMSENYSYLNAGVPIMLALCINKSSDGVYSCVWNYTPTEPISGTDSESLIYNRERIPWTVNNYTHGGCGQVAINEETKEVVFCYPHYGQVSTMFNALRYDIYGIDSKGVYRFKQITHLNTAMQILVGNNYLCMFGTDISNRPNIDSKYQNALLFNNWLTEKGVTDLTGSPFSIANNNTTWAPVSLLIDKATLESISFLGCTTNSNLSKNNNYTEEEKLLFVYPLDRSRNYKFPDKWKDNKKIKLTKDKEIESKLIINQVYGYNNPDLYADETKDYIYFGLDIDDKNMLHILIDEEDSKAYEYASDDKNVCYGWVRNFNDDFIHLDPKKTVLLLPIKEDDEFLYYAYIDYKDWDEIQLFKNTVSNVTTTYNFKTASYYGYETYYPIKYQLMKINKGGIDASNL